jgi:hypothetical protein
MKCDVLTEEIQDNIGACLEALPRASLIWSFQLTTVSKSSVH